MWNAQRTQALYRTFYQMLYPLFAKEVEEKLLQEAKDFVIKVTEEIINTPGLRCTFHTVQSLITTEYLCRIYLFEKPFSGN